MADDTGALEGLGKIIPSAYYDLIARVCSGVPFLAILLWEHRGSFGDVTWAKLTLVLGVGYIVGLVLTPLSFLWGLLQLLVRRVLKMPAWKWREGPQLSDLISAKNKEAGATLAKMQAEAILCQNLFTAFLLLIIINKFSPFAPISGCSACCRTLILLILGFSSAHRIAAYLYREKRLCGIYNRADTAAGPESP
jgi:hypothetical protein